MVAMGERFDVLVTAPDHPVPLTVLAEGKPGRTFAVLAAGTGSRPTMASVLEQLEAVVSATAWTADASVRLPAKDPDVTHTLMLTGSMDAYEWGIIHRQYDPQDLFASAVNIRAGQRVRLDCLNHTMMRHPMHLHGHTFQVGDHGPFGTL